MLEQNMHVSICVCKVCLCVLQDNQEADITYWNTIGRQNLPMSTGFITTAITMQYNDKT